MGVIGIREAVEDHEAILLQSGLFVRREVQVIIDAFEVFGYFFAVPGSAGFFRRDRGRSGAFLGGADMIIADEACVCAFWGDGDLIAKHVIAICGAMSFQGGERLGVFARDDGGNSRGEGAGFFRRHVA